MEGRCCWKRGRVCFCSAAAVSQSRPGPSLKLIELPLGCFSPQIGTAGGDLPPRAGLTTPATPSWCLLPPAPTSPSPAEPPLGLPYPYSCTVLSPNRRGGGRGSARTTVMSTVRLVSFLREYNTTCWPISRKQFHPQRPSDRHA